MSTRITLIGTVQADPANITSDDSLSANADLGDEQIYGNVLQGRFTVPSGTHLLPVGSIDEINFLWLRKVSGDPATLTISTPSATDQTVPMGEQFMREGVYGEDNPISAVAITGECVIQYIIGGE